MAQLWHQYIPLEQLELYTDVEPCWALLTEDPCNPPRPETCHVNPIQLQSS